MTASLNRRTALGLMATAPSLAWGQAPRFAAALTKAQSLDQLHSLIIAQRGEVIAAETFRGPKLDTPVNVKSVSKSLVSALTGIAIAKGEIPSLDTQVAPLIARQVPRRADKRVKDITVRHMLTMQSGLQDVSGAEYGAWVDSKFWIFDALSKPMVADPGTAMLYSTASYHVLGAILSAVSGKDLHQLAVERLGDPLGIALPKWTRDPQGLYLGGNDMRVSPRGMLAFGEMYRQGGGPVLSKTWVADSWTIYGHSLETGHGYGFGWFVWDVGGYRVSYARGYGGQMIFVVPALAMTVVMTSDISRPARLDGHLGALFDLFSQQILPVA